MKLGVHISTSGDLISTPARAAAMGAETIQMFASNPRGWRPTKYTPKKAQEFRTAVAAAGIDPVWFHMIYLVSFGTPDEEQREKSILATQQTLAAADLLGAKGVITHMGSHKGLGFDQALERIKDSYTRALEESEKSLLIMEIAAGQGGAIGNSLEELAAQLDVMKGHPRMAVCIDTCHALSAGYELRTPEGLDDFLAKFDSLIGLDRLAVLHLNDSKNGLGAKIDRHENIGDGTIGLDGMRNIINHPKLAGISGVLEVPGIDGKSGPDKENMDRLLALRA